MKLTFAFILFTVSIFPLRADVVIDVEEAALHQIAVGIKFFREVNGGEYPINWEDIATIVDLEKNDRPLLEKQGYRLMERYDFIRQPVSYQGLDGGKILMVRLVPLTGRNNETKQKYRYFIYESAVGAISQTSMSEEKLQEMFKTANVELPKDATLPAVETESPTGPPPATEPAVIPQASAVQQETPMQPPLPEAMVEKSPSSSGFPIVSTTIIMVLVIGATAFFLRRKQF